MDLKDRLRTALSDLGATREEMVAKLREKGINGVIGSCRRCPVARYLATAFPEASWLEVGHYLVYIQAPKEKAIQYTTTAVQAFIESFDRKDYPDLIAEACAA